WVTNWKQIKFGNKVTLVLKPVILECPHSNECVAKERSNKAVHPNQDSLRDNNSSVSDFQSRWIIPSRMQFIFVVNGFKYGSLVTYYFRFQAVNKAGNSDWSPVFPMATKSVGNVTPNAANNGIMKS
uniref:Fibronectin type-III domain-containing protein n=1 Tax=Romanomermis culicivorax TaxID=13658 RepID=A0A915HTA1_ROMCU